MAKTEIELKLMLSKEALDRFRRRSALKNLTIDKPQTRKLKSVYFDTPDLRLYKADMSLRIRRSGKKRILTVKSGKKLNNGLSKRREYEREVKKSSPNLKQIKDKALKRQLVKVIDDQPLKPVFETIIWRTVRNIKMPKTGVVELALDHGQIRAGDKTSTIQEVELEQKSGGAMALHDAAETLFADDLIEISDLSKSERGYGLVTGKTRSTRGQTQPVKGRKPVLHASMTNAEALSELGQAASEQVLINWRAILDTSDPEGPHQMRVGLRRLRTALKVFKSAVKSSHLLKLRQDARDLGRIVGTLRDADVLLSDIYMPAAKELFGNRNSCDLLDVLKLNIESKRIVVREQIENPQWTALKLNCILFENAMVRPKDKKSRSSNDGEVMELGRKSLDKCWRRTKLWGQQIDTLSVAERHEMRKELKSLRYATEFFQSLYPIDTTQPFLKQLKLLQDIFGYLNDVALADGLSSIVKESHPNRKDLLKDSDLLRDWHKSQADEAWKGAKNRWGELISAPKFWH